MQIFKIVATTLFGLEEVLAEEIRAIGGTEIEVLIRAVAFRGNQAILYKSNLLLRTAIKVLKPIDTFIANNEQQLYDNIKLIDWSQYFDCTKTFAIDGTTSGEIFTHSKFVALKSKDAIADQFREKFNQRPSIDVEDPDVRINIHIHHTTVAVSLDSSGSSLGKRNYRLEQTEAPISEILAAGMILLSGWNRQSDFIDAMCGSGTIPIEAALIAGNIPPGKNRFFGFETWCDFDYGLWNSIKTEAENKMIHSTARIFGKDIDPKAVNIAQANAKRAGVDAQISFEQCDFFSSTHESGQGIVMMNPPYGERLQIEEIGTFYNEIGTRLKHFYMGCDAWIISSSYDALKHFGLKPSKKIRLFNGPLECRLMKYELYAGSKKTKDTNDGEKPQQPQQPVHPKRKLLIIKPKRR